MMMKDGEHGKNVIITIITWQNQTDKFDREFLCQFDQARLKTWPPVKLVRTDICHQLRYFPWPRVAFSE